MVCRDGMWDDVRDVVTGDGVRGWCAGWCVCGWCVWGWYLGQCMEQCLWGMVWGQHEDGTKESLTHANFPVLAKTKLLYKPVSTFETLG